MKTTSRTKLLIYKDKIHVMKVFYYYIFTKKILNQKRSRI